MPTVRTAGRQASRKSKKSFSLSNDSVAFLEALRKRRRANSVSSVLEDILLSVRRAEEKRAIEQSIGEYYDGLSPAEREEETNWGAFALRQFSSEDS